jgi:hypothetical protein
MKVVTIFIVMAVFFLWVRVITLEDNMVKFNQAVKTLAGGLMELKLGGN